MFRRARTDEATLTSTDPRLATDPRIILLREPCPRCKAPRGIYCTTSGGYTTLHKTHNPQGLRRLEESWNR